ncbi:MAG: site-specific DNA-methyltransferase [Chloroflexi bacterium]|nr:site-specific DNA-methyltransferase [Chloroflexota bacterium]
MEQAMKRPAAPRNRTLTLSNSERKRYKENLVRLSSPTLLETIQNRTIHQSIFEILDWLPSSFVDLLFLDPPYNLTKTFGSNGFKQQSNLEYAEWFESWFPRLLRILKPSASVYICGDWRSSAAIQLIAEKYLSVRNRITWEREKGRGAKRNWKNCSEDIWFCTRSNDYYFDADAVKLKRRVIAPYTDLDGDPKDWAKSREGNFRLTYPSNLWTDLTVPFWSMPENTDHPTQKPEKLLAKIILASSAPGDMIFDPFLGSGTTAVVAKKLGRCYVGVETELDYCLYAEKRLAIAARDKTIQGFAEGVFWERNSLQAQQANRQE